MIIDFRATFIVSYVLELSHRESVTYLPYNPAHILCYMYAFHVYLCIAQNTPSAFKLERLCKNSAVLFHVIL